LVVESAASCFAGCQNNHPARGHCLPISVFSSAHFGRDAFGDFEQRAPGEPHPGSDQILLPSQIRAFRLADVVRVSIRYFPRTASPSISERILSSYLMAQGQTNLMNRREASEPLLEHSYDHCRRKDERLLHGSRQMH
jgi:hypothetical protein